MRISDWSSDVCSSDLFVKKVAPGAITVNLVCFAAGASCYLDETIMAAEGEIDGAAFIGRDFEMDPGDHDWAEGSFVVAKGFSIRHEGQGKRSEERRVGKKWVSTCIDRGVPER